MALREKFNSLAAEAASKASSLASEAANKANTAIENGRLGLKISSEEKKIDTYTTTLGQLLLDKLDAGETFDDEVMALYSSIQAARQVIAAARAEIEANRQREQAEDGPHCPSCGQAVAGEDKFCSQCGVRLQEEAIAVTEDAPAEAAPAQEPVAETAPGEEPQPEEVPGE
ncbi:MAG: zinc ribbon domain-containing protein [Clostridiales bacterium]|nr:zinc ribbon domain-containing protein [Clostridiales bacterium]